MMMKKESARDMSKPRLYPTDGDMSKTWYVEYPNVNGGKPLKKYGSPNLNSIQDKDERIKAGLDLCRECEQYCPKSNNVTEVVSMLSEVVEDRMQGKKYKTVTGYKSKLQTFCFWFREVEKSTLKKDTGVRFLRYVSKGGRLSNTTINGYRRHLKSFFAELVKNEKFPFNPFDNTNKLRESVSTKSWFSTELQQKLQEMIEPVDPQLWLCCEIQFYCFIRPGDEMANLTIADIGNRGENKKQWKFKVRAESAKTGKFRFVPIPAVLQKRLAAHIDGYPDHYYLFSNEGHPSNKIISKNKLYNNHKVYMEALDLPKGYSLYSWKNTGAVMMYFNGVRMKFISMLMGHSDYSITDGYFKSLGIDDVMNDVNINYPDIGVSS